MKDIHKIIGLGLIALAVGLALYALFSNAWGLNEFGVVVPSANGAANKPTCAALAAGSAIVGFLVYRFGLKPT